MKATLRAEFVNLPNILTYIRVADCDASAKKAESLGAEVCVPPTDIPTIGRFAVLRDPQGVVISVIRMEDNQ